MLAQRRRLINTILQMPINFVFCFRSKEKMIIRKGEDPKTAGFMPIAGDEFVYEMTLKLLLLPSADGRPTLTSENPGERIMIKLPGQFRVAPFTDLIRGDVQINEDLGEALARWAAGSPATAGNAKGGELVARYAACSDAATLRAITAEVRASWTSFTAADKKAINAAADEAKERIKNEGKSTSKTREMGED